MNSSQTTQTNPSWIKDVLYLSLFLIFFYTLWLGSYPLFTPDEGRYAEIAREMVASGDYITPRVNGVAFLDKPILFYWLQACAIFLFGIKEWTLRLMPALIGIAGCLTTYLCGRKLFDRRTGLFAALILSSSPLYFGAAHYVNLDLEVAVLLSTSLLLFICGMTSQAATRRYLLLAAYSFSGLAVLTKGLIGLVLPAAIIFAWISYQKCFHYLKKMDIIYGLLLFLVIVIPWYLLVQHNNPAFLHYFFVIQHFSRFLSTGDFNNASPTWFYVPVVLIGFSPWILFAIAPLKKQIKAIYLAPKQHAICLFLLLWVGIVFIFFSIPHSKIVGYILPIFPPLALLAGHYLSELWLSIARKKLFSLVSSYALINISIVILLLITKKQLELPFSFLPYLISMITIFIVGAICSLYALKIKKYSLPYLFIICFMTNTAFLLSLTKGISHLNVNSAKTLVIELKNIKQNTDEVISYFKYYQDIPLYLNETITVVADWQAPDILRKDNWRRELWYGKRFQPTDDFLIDEQTFWRRFHSNKRIFVFLNENYLEQFKLQAHHYFYLAKSNDIILLSNQPTVY